MARADETYSNVTRWEGRVMDGPGGGLDRKPQLGRLAWWSPSIKGQHQRSWLRLCNDVNSMRPGHRWPLRWKGLPRRPLLSSSPPFLQLLSSIMWTRSTVCNRFRLRHHLECDGNPRRARSPLRLHSCPLISINHMFD